MKINGKTIPTETISNDDGSDYKELVEIVKRCNTIYSNLNKNPIKGVPMARLSHAINELDDIVGSLKTTMSDSCVELNTVKGRRCSWCDGKGKIHPLRMCGYCEGTGERE